MRLWSQSELSRDTFCWSLVPNADSSESNADLALEDMQIVPHDVLLVEVQTRGSARANQGGDASPTKKTKLNQRWVWPLDVSRRRGAIDAAHSANGSEKCSTKPVETPNGVLTPSSIVNGIKVDSNESGGLNNGVKGESYTDSHRKKPRKSHELTSILKVEDNKGGDMLPSTPTSTSASTPTPTERDSKGGLLGGSSSATSSSAAPDISQSVADVVPGVRALAVGRARYRVWARSVSCKEFETTITAMINSQE